MDRVSRIVAVLLVSGALSACGAETSPEAVRPSVPAAPSAAGSVAPTVWPSPSRSAPQVSFAQAMSRYVRDNYGGDHRYVGDCGSARPDPKGVCSVRKATVDAGTVYGVGVPYSEIDAFLLVREDDSGWRVVDHHLPPSDPGGPAAGPEPAWFEGSDF